jgi:dolichol kinase
MAAPVWICVVEEGSAGGAPLKMAAAFSGITILGIADSSASALGRQFGRHPILGTSKTLEGTLGGIVCNVGFWWVLSLFFESERTLGGFLYASAASCALEAATTQLDNIFLPLHHVTLLLL